MEVHVTLFATLRGQGPPKRVVDLARDSRVLDLIRALEIPRDKARIIFVNHRLAGMETPLHAGDRVGIFPHISGG